MSGDTRAFLESVGRAVRRIDVLRAEIAELEEGGDPRCGDRVHSPGISDPTSSAAIGRLGAIDERRSAISDCEDLIGEGLVLVANVRARLGDMHGEVIDRYYIDGQSWEDIAFDLMVSRSTCIRYRDAACEWADGLGIEVAKSPAGA